MAVRAAATTAWLNAGRGEGVGIVTRDDDRNNLLAVLRDTRAYLARPNNDFAWSRWANGAQALAEFDSHIDALDRDEPIDLCAVRHLFGPTASLQEVSISSGWGDEFLILASRFDCAIGESWRVLR